MTIGAVSSNPYVNTASYSPYTQNPVVADGNSNSGSGFSTDFSSISSMVANGAGGGFTSYKMGATMAGNMKSIFTKGNFMNGLKGTAITGFKGAGLSALVSAGVSAAANGYGVATGKIDSSAAVSNVIKDSIGGAVGGLAAVTAGGFGHMLLGRFGVVGTIASVGLGAAAGVAGGQLAKKFTDGF
jgi:hypothetical protein